MAFHRNTPEGSGHSASCGQNIPAGLPLLGLLLAPDQLLFGQLLLGLQAICFSGLTPHQNRALRTKFFVKINKLKENNTQNKQGSFPANSHEIGKSSEPFFDFRDIALSGNFGP
uniref:(northern house mosquito) hypothetical protein n=1 Tax=Culex pipiens TaxID=7175 RepID=A0A8D8AM87_CULPI